MPDSNPNPYAKYGGVLLPEVTGSPQPTTGGSPTPNPYAKYGGVFIESPTAPRVESTAKAAQPGAYQQAKDAPVRNANTEAANPFTDSTTSVIPDLLGTKQQGALMKRPEESDSQFLTRVREAAKSVKPSAIEVEHRSDIARTIPTLGAALAAGPAALTAGAGAAEVPGMVGPAVEGTKVVAKWVATNPLKAYLVFKTAEELGIGPHKIMRLLHIVGSE